MDIKTGDYIKAKFIIVIFIILNILLSVIFMIFYIFIIINFKHNLFDNWSQCYILYIQLDFLTLARGDFTISNGISSNTLSNL